jgi:hypothetical protein
MTTTKQAQWLLVKERTRLENKQSRGVKIDPTVRPKPKCGCGHSQVSVIHFFYGHRDHRNRPDQGRLLSANLI